MRLAAAADDREDPRHLAAGAQGLQDRLDLANLVVGSADGRPLGCGDRDEEHAPVLGRGQLLRQGAVQPPGGAGDQRRHQQDQDRRVEGAPEQRPVAARDHARDARLQPGAGTAAFGALEQLGAERRTEGERHQHREQHGDPEHEAELGEQPARLALEKGDRHEHRDQGERGRDHREGHLAGAEHARDQRALAELDPALDVLEHHDRVVDHDPDREDQRQEGQDVDREAERVDADEGADHRDRDGDRRHRGRARRGEKREDHQHDQHDRDPERLEHLVDRPVDEDRVVRADLDVHARGQSRADQIELRARPGSRSRSCSPATGGARRGRPPDARRSGRSCVSSSTPRSILAMSPRRTG